MIRAAVLGSPISHSLSPILHRTAYTHLKIAAKYSQFEVKSGQLQSFLDSHRDLNALSLTMPLKEEALTVVHQVSDLARQISSGNTLHMVGDQWHLTSTDVAGFAQAMRFNNTEISGKLLLIGAGATARAVVAACDGVSQEIHIISRNPDREILIRAAAPNSKLIFHPWVKTALINSADLVVNTTPGTAADFFIDSVSNPIGSYFEVLYHPWPTQLFSHWLEQGSPTIDGIELLVQQAISQVEIFAGVQVDRLQLSLLMRQAALTALADLATRQRSNLQQ